MNSRPALSLIIPTRKRPAQLHRLLTSLADTTTYPQAVEILLVVDADDPDSAPAAFAPLLLKRVIVPPGLTMGALNLAGYHASSGDYLMLLNDDVVARTRDWDQHVLGCFHRFPDGIALVHTNDTVFSRELCVFPLVSRIFCELAGGICPPDYTRYRIDDHIHDVFKLLAILDEPRVVYLPEVIFEHDHFVTRSDGRREYLSDLKVLARDAPRFIGLLPERKALALKLKEHIEHHRGRTLSPEYRTRLDNFTPSFPPLPPPTGLLPRLAASGQRAFRCWRNKGFPGLLRAGWRRLLRRPAPL